MPKPNLPIIRHTSLPHIARMAVQYGVDPENVVDAALSQMHYLDSAIGEDQWARELAAGSSIVSRAATGWWARRR